MRADPTSERIPLELVTDVQGTKTALSATAMTMVMPKKYGGVDSCVCVISSVPDNASPGRFHHHDLSRICCVFDQLTVWYINSIRRQERC